MQLEETKITTTIPFLKAKTVLLIEDPVNPIRIPHPDFWEEIRYHFKRTGYHFIFIPELLSGITPMIADYLFPGYDAPNASATYELIRELAGIENRCGLIYKKGRATWFKELSVEGKGLKIGRKEGLFGALFVT